MAGWMSREQGRALLLAGKAPENRELSREVTVGLDSLSDFWERIFLQAYLPEGGSKIKFITGHPGSGKTHFARWIQAVGEDQGYQTVSFSAREVWLHDFRNIYVEIVRQCDLEALLSACAKRVVRGLGYDPEEIPEGGCFTDLLSERGENDAMNKKAIRDSLREMFTKNPLLDNTFAQACSLLTGGVLGHPVLEDGNRQVLFSWIRGEQQLKAAQLRAAGLAAVTITKYNARHLLRSLCELIHMAGKPGLLVVADDLEVLLNQGAGEVMRYSKGKRDDTYESIRQLIDDIDSLKHAMFLFCLDRELIDNESLGMKSYQALWMRIQNEVISTRFNRFADIVDMDRYGEEIYTPDKLAEMSGKLTAVAAEAGVSVQALSPEAAARLRERAAFGQLGIPYMMNRETMEGERSNG